MSPQTKKVLFTTIGGIATVGVIYVVYMLLKKKPSSFGEIVEDTKATIVDIPTLLKTTVTSNFTDNSFPLKKGSGGSNVVSLQNFLNKSSGYNLVADGKFGDKTETAVIEEQSPFDAFKGMYPDAIKGQVTQSYFNAFIKGKY